MQETIQTYNIQPQAGVIGVFSRLNYKPWYAIAEFVDNSTQSFYSHESLLAENGIGTVSIHIDYDPDNDILTIRDTAFGMELNDFLRAIKVDSPPENNGGRNEFGMGLKTAASWFGEVWSVESTQFGSPNKYFAEIDIPYMRKNSINSISIRQSESPLAEHGTTIVIKQITKKISAPRTKSKIIQLLSSMYRRDLNNGKISIYYDEEPLSFSDYDCLRFRDKVWKRDVNFPFEFDRQIHRVKGFVGILAAGGGFGKAGFALFRRDRVVIGGEDMNYKPEHIFIQAQSTIAHKLFGELDLDDFPINQAKDGFVWEDGLEDAFVEALKKEIKEYIDIARLTNKERAEEESHSKEVSDEIHKDVQASLDRISRESDPYNSSDTPKVSEQDHLQFDLDLFKEYQNEQNNLPEEIDEKVREYKLDVDAVTTICVKVQWTIGNGNTWINVDIDEDNKNASLTININHPFFKPFSEKPDFKAVLEKFALAFVLAEMNAKEVADPKGLIMPNTFRNNINKYLKQLSDDE